MTVRDVMKELIRLNCSYTLLALDFLINEKRVITLDDDIKKAQWYFQPRFKKKMDMYIADYKRKKEGAVS